MAGTNLDRISSLRSPIAVMGALQSALALMEWDLSCYMPEGGSEQRAEQSSALRALLHNHITDNKFADAVESFRSDANLSSDEKIIVEDLWEQISRARNIPEQLVRQVAAQESRTHSAWLKAKAENSFDLVSAQLADLIALKKEYAAAIDSRQPAYDVLLDVFEPKSNQQNVASIFDTVRGFLADAAKELRARHSNSSAAKPLSGTFPMEKQKVFLKSLGSALGFDFSRGRLDTTAHPFCVDINPDDIRITIRERESDILQSTLSLVHEVGHGLYEQGLDRSFPYTAVSRHCSMGVHESQSLFWERHITITPGGTRLLRNLVQQEFPHETSSWTAEQIYSHYTQPSSSIVRLEADEIHYALHILFRFDLEVDLFSGRITPAQLEDEWNDRVFALFGKRPTNPREGILQDIHWYFGGFGYFSTYLLGAIYAAQIAHVVEEKFPNLELRIEQANLSEVLEFLREKIHRVGKRLPPLQLIEQATDRPVSTDFYRRYLTKKYSL